MGDVEISSLRVANYDGAHLKAALFSASDFSKQKILVGSENYLKKSTK